MNRLIFLVSLLAIPSIASGQVSKIKRYFQADSLIQLNDIKGAYNLYKELKPRVDTTDTLYSYVVWYYLATATELEKESRMHQDFESSLKLGQVALELIEENKQFFDDEFAGKEFWMNRNIIVSYFGLERIDDAKKYKDKLYAGYRDKTLPQGIDGYFNFDFFKLAEKNVWGYEWYPELPEDRFSTSFTKIVYYVYSTNPDGTDKDQLYRLHVLMFHQESRDAKFDYLLEKQYETDDLTVSGSYYQFTYRKDIDYLKLKGDVKEIIEKDIQPSTRRALPRDK